MNRLRTVQPLAPVLDVKSFNPAKESPFAFIGDEIRLTLATPRRGSVEFRRLNVSNDNCVQLCNLGRTTSEASSRVGYTKSVGDIMPCPGPSKVSFKTSFHGSVATGTKLGEVVFDNSKDVEDAGCKLLKTRERIHSFFDSYSGRVAFITCSDSVWVVDT